MSVTENQIGAVDAAARREIEDACHKLVVEYTHVVDFGRASEIADLFTPDGLWESSDARYSGREVIRTSFMMRQKQTERTSRHVCTNVSITVLDADTAEGLTYLSLYRSDSRLDDGVAPLHGPLLVGNYIDKFVRTPDGWKFSVRTVEVAFRRQPPAP